MTAATARQRVDYRRPRSALATVNSAAKAPARTRADRDWYVEPREAVEALLDAERFSGKIADPACGKGTICWALIDRGLEYSWASDVVGRGFVPAVIRDFLCDEIPPTDNIVCNPPFSLAEEFIVRALAVARHKVAMLLRLSFLEGQRRARLFAETPLARVHVFSWRISMPPGGVKIEATGGAVAFAWFVWEHGWTGPPQLRWLARPRGGP